MILSFHYKCQGYMQYQHHIPSLMQQSPLTFLIQIPNMSLEFLIINMEMPIIEPTFFLANKGFYAIIIILLIYYIICFLNIHAFLYIHRPSVWTHNKSLIPSNSHLSPCKAKYQFFLLNRLCFGEKDKFAFHPFL